MTWFTIGEHI